MPIKDQCNRCRYQVDDNCTRLAPTYDGAGCEFYMKRIDLRKEHIERGSEVAAANLPLGSEDPGEKRHEDIHGWLLFFLVIFVGFGSVISFFELFTIDYAGENIWISVFMIVTMLVYIASGIFTIVAFKKRDTDAVFLAKTYVITRFVLSIIAMMSDDNTPRETGQTISSAIWCIVWYLFLMSSKQVRRQIPVRKSKTRDWILIGAITLMPIFFLAMGIVSEIESNSNSEAEAAALANLELLENQFSDGRIVLTIPDGMDCEESDIDGLTLFSISDAESGADVTVVSDYDDDVTKKNFNEYWRAWKPDDLNSLKYKVVKDEKESAKGITIFYKLVRVATENPIDWEFALVFDQKTGKVCVISGYSGAEGESPVADIINNLEFL